MNDTSPVTARIAALRQWMRRHELDAFVIPSTDPHAGEYVPGHWQTRRWFTGFDGSAGTAVVTDGAAALWTDSRYFLAAESQLAGTPLSLMREGLPGTPSIAEWLCTQVKPSGSVGIDGSTCTAVEFDALSGSLSAGGIRLVATGDPADELWPGRPALPATPVRIHPLEYAGREAKDKLAGLRRAARQSGCSHVLVTALDEVAWLLNLRGGDVPCNPVFVAYLLVAPDTATLYVDPGKIPPGVAGYLGAQGITTRPYGTVEADLGKLRGAALLLPATVNHRLAAAAHSAVPCRTMPSPVAPAKAVKNAAEIAGMRRSMERDGVAMVKLLRWLLPAVAEGGVTETGVDLKLAGLRAASPSYLGPSFGTIAGYGAHAAIVHYEATPETDATLRPSGLLLLDTGAQYADGTTDITRTVALGPVSDEERRAYTLVLKGHIALSRCRFPDGASGTQLDAAARYWMWREGMNYGHGTGHGVGAHLNVHEGPHQIRMNYVAAPLRAGMTVTDEPGIYAGGRFGVRLENTLLVRPWRETEYGRFLEFEPLTLCPFDRSPIDRGLLRGDEEEWLDDYHRTVRLRLLPLLDDEADRAWLVRATRPLREE